MTVSKFIHWSTVDGASLQYILKNITEAQARNILFKRSFSSYGLVPVKESSVRGMPYRCYDIFQVENSICELSGISRDQLREEVADRFCGRKKRSVKSLAKNGELLKEALYTDRADKNKVRAAVSSNYTAIQHASNNLQIDYDVMNDAVIAASSTGAASKVPALVNYFSRARGVKDQNEMDNIQVLIAFHDEDTRNNLGDRLKSKYASSKAGLQSAQDAKTKAALKATLRASSYLSWKKNYEEGNFADPYIQHAVQSEMKARTHNRKDAVNQRLWNFANGVMSHEFRSRQYIKKPSLDRYLTNKSVTAEIVIVEQWAVAYVTDRSSDRDIWESSGYGWDGKKGSRVTRASSNKAPYFGTQRCRPTVNRWNKNTWDNTTKCCAKCTCEEIAFLTKNSIQTKREKSFKAKQQRLEIERQTRIKKEAEERRIRFEKEAEERRIREAKALQTQAAKMKVARWTQRKFREKQLVKQHESALKAAVHALGLTRAMSLIGKCANNEAKKQELSQLTGKKRPRIQDLTNDSDSENEMDEEVEEDQQDDGNAHAVGVSIRTKSKRKRQRLVWKEGLPIYFLKHREGVKIMYEGVYLPVDVIKSRGQAMNEVENEIQVKYHADNATEWISEAYMQEHLAKTGHPLIKVSVSSVARVDKEIKIKLEVVRKDEADKNAAAVAVLQDNLEDAEELNKYMYLHQDKLMSTIDDQKGKIMALTR